MSSRPRIVFLGICSGDPALIAQWTASGDLPAIAKLLRTSRVGTTTGLPGVFVGAHWPSFITGCHPAKNRVHSWQQIEPGTYRQYRCRAGDQMQRRPFWDYLSDAGRRICVLDVPHSRLSPAINGIQTVEWGAHDGAYGFQASSAALDREIRERFGLHPVSGDSDPMLDFEDPLAFRDLLLRGIAMKRDLTRHFLARERWDFFAQVFTEAHCAGHLLWYLHDPTYRWHHGPAPAGTDQALKQVYVAIDQALGAILDDLDDETTVILLANHGMGPKYNAQHLLDRALVGLGYAAPAVTPPRQRTWRDVVDPPLSRAWQVLPAAVRSSLAPLRDVKRRVVNPSTSPPPVIDAAASRAFTIVNNTAHGAIRVNLSGREPGGRVQPGSEYEELLAAISHDLSQLRNLETGGPIVEAIYRCDDLYPGPERPHLPDLFVEWTSDAPVNAIGSERLPRLEGVYRYVRSGEHRREGLFAMRGPGVEPGRIRNRVGCMDFAPTIAGLLGVALPEDIDGRPIATPGC
jgi:predicted AlkP superfamily phosphohydrolase/phosphomutase